MKNDITYIICYSNNGEDAQSKKRRTCRAGAGIESEEGNCTTPGFKLREKPEAEYDPRNYWVLHLPRNNKRMLQSSKLLAQSNRANGDVGFMFYEKNPMEPSPEETRKVVGYIVDYASKSNETEKQTRDGMKTLIMAEKSIEGSKRDMARVTVRSMNQLVKNQLKSKQETICLNAGLKLFECSSTIDKISVNGYRTVNAEGKLSSTDKFTHYAKREDCLDMSFYDWICQYKNKINTGRKYIPHFVGADTRAVFPITEQYARNILFLYRPWQGSFEKTLVEGKSILEQYAEFRSSRDCPKMVTMEYDRAKDYHDNKYKEPEVATGNNPPEDAAMDRFTDPETATAVELYGTLCAAVAEDGCEMEQLDLGLNKDWTASHYTLPNGMTVDDASNWIMERAKLTSQADSKVEMDSLYTNQLDLPLKSDGTKYKPENLNDDQKQVFYYVMKFLKDWIEQKRMGNHTSTTNRHQSEKQFLLTIAGEGGSGKSTLVKTLVSVVRQMFQINSTALVAAPTGSASFNGGGVTMHRLFGLGVNSSNGNMGAEKEQRLKQTFRNVVIQVFDERSMISAENLGMIDEHARKVVHHGTNSSMPFGGIPIVLMVGDDFQLPPVTAGVSGTFSDDQDEDEGNTAGEANQRKAQMKNGKRNDVKVGNVGRCAMTKQGQKLFKLMGKKYIKLNTCERVLKDQQLLPVFLKGVRGDSERGISELNIQKLMMYHLRSDYWTPELILQVLNDERTIHLFATNKNKDDHNWKRLRQINSSQRHVAIIKAVTNEKCNGRKRGGHFDEERMPYTTIFCVGCKVSLVGINIKPEWGLYHGAIKRFWTLYTGTRKDHMLLKMQLANNLPM